VKRISVIIPFVDETEVLPIAVDSVLSNRLGDYDMEIIVCNDGNYPNSAIAARLSSEARSIVKIVSNENSQGPGGCRNTAINHASGDIYAFLDADDYWKPGKLAAQMALLESGITFSATGYYLGAESTVIVPPNTISSPLQFFSKRGIGTSTVVITRTLLGESRFRDIRFAQDVDLWHRLAKKKEFKYQSTLDTFAFYRKGGRTSNKLRQSRYFWSVMMTNGLPKTVAAIIFLKYSLDGLYKHFIRAYIYRKNGA
jgi:teichuronic acid biosynthesis glycosyltransferase TuaG